MPISYQWQTATTSTGTYSSISGATANTYTLQGSDVGNFIRCNAQYTNNNNLAKNINSKATPAIGNGAGTQTLPEPTSFTTSSGTLFEYGVVFTVLAAGYISAVRFYKLSGDPATTHTCRLWDNTGVLLGTCATTSETTSGWQQANFAAPIAVTASTTYRASYSATIGTVRTDSYYVSTVTTGNLQTAANAGQYGTVGTFPNSSPRTTNWGLSVLFNTATASSMPYVNVSTDSLSISGNPLSGSVLTASLIVGGGTNEIFIGCIGDSIMAGGAVLPAAPPSNKVCTVLNNLYASSFVPISLNNSALGGTTSTGWLPNAFGGGTGLFDGALGAFNSQSVNISPGKKYVICHLGTNDNTQSIPTATFLQNMTYIAAAFNAAGYVFVPMKCISNTTYDAVQNSIVNATTILQGDTLAQQYFIDHASDLGSDALHPNATGSDNLGKLWGHALWKLIFSPKAPITTTRRASALKL